MAVGQLNNGLFLLCFLWNRPVPVRTVPVCVCTLTGQALSTLLSYTMGSTAASLLSRWVLNHLHHYEEGHCADRQRRGEGEQKKSLPPDVLVYQRDRTMSTSFAEALPFLLSTHGTKARTLYIFYCTSVIPVAAVCLFLSAA